jgi:CheY-like chemotaxis protein
MTPASSSHGSDPAGTVGPAVAPLRVAVFDDVVAARAEHFHIPGLAVEVFAHADDVVRACTEPAERGGGDRFDVVLMDFAMGPGRKTGHQAVVDLRAAGFAGRIVAISSDPAANAAMRAAGADDALAAKAHLRSYLVHLGSKRLAGRSGR